MSKTWHESALKLSETGVLSWREIAKVLDVPKSSVSDFLREYYKQKEQINVGDYEKPPTKKKGITHLVIPDSQVKPNVSLEYLSWIGKYIVRKQPDVIIHLGDFNDLESLSSYDRGKKSAEGKRLNKDIEAGVKGMQLLLSPLRALQWQQQESGQQVYKPRLVLTLGNHEDRLTRHVNANPELEGFLTMKSLGYENFGWEVIPYLQPIEIDGINYVHYFQNVMTGKSMAGNALTKLKNVAQSFTHGHVQTLDIATRFLPTNGQQQWGLAIGACYEQDEDYKGVQGNKHYRGIVLKHNVFQGNYDPMFVSLDWLKAEYGNN